MPTTLTTAISQARERVGELSPTAWSDQALRGWINEAVRDIARRTETLQTEETISVDAGDQEVDLPANVLRVYRATFTEDNNPTNTYPLEYADFNAMDSIWWSRQASTQSTPRMFTMWGAPPALKAVLYPRPSTDGELEVFYYRLPDKLAIDGSDDSELLDVVEGYDDLVYDYAAYLALRRDRDPRWQEHRVSYEQAITAMMDQTRRWSDQPGAMSRSGAMIPQWLYDPGYM